MQGYVAPGYGAVAEAFQENFRKHGEIGAAFCAVRDREIVVDIWGGVADRGSRRPWAEDSLQLVFSGTKGFAATCMLMLIDRGHIHLDDPVQRYWPGFNKSRVLVRDVLAHTARLPGVDEPLTVGDLTDDRRMAERLERQEQSADPRAALCYHALTYGWLCGELVRRTDGRSIGHFFADEVAKPLGLDLWIGLPAALESRVTTLELSPGWGVSGHLRVEAYERDRLLRSAWGNPEFMTHRSFPWNLPRFHQSEIPGANGIGTARSIAKLYGVLASGGSPLLSEKTMRLGQQTLSQGYDDLYAEHRRFGVGFQLQTETAAYGPPADAFGHGGAGGSIHGAWPTERVGFSYSMNLMLDGQRPDPRPTALLNVLHSCVARPEL